MTETKPEPSPFELQSRRRRAIVSAAITAVLTLVQIGLLVASYNRNAPLRGDGLVSAQATVTGFDYNRRTSDEVSVSYEVPGDGTVTADIPVSRRFDDGEIVQVQYSADDPRLVRTVDDWTPNYRSPFLIIVALVMVSFLVYFLVGIARPSVMRSTTAARREPPTGPLGVSLFTWMRVGLVGAALLVGAIVGFMR